jgi:hypothetical protein
VSAWFIFLTPVKRAERKIKATVAAYPTLLAIESGDAPRSYQEQRHASTARQRCLDPSFLGEFSESPRAVGRSPCGHPTFL